MIHIINVQIWLVLVLAMSLGCKKKTMESEQQEKDSIVFSGYTWLVKHSIAPVAPGPNYWSSKNVWVDDQDRLHLRVNKDATGKWSCAEVYTREHFGYGTYQFWIEGATDRLDKNVVLGLFAYSGKDGYDEIDIECARWGSDTGPNLSYVVWPPYGSSENKWVSTHSFSLNTPYTTQRFIRTHTSVTFQSLYGFSTDNQNEFFTQTCTAGVSTVSMPVHINLWLFNAPKPSDEKEVEIIIHGFTYLP